MLHQPSAESADALLRYRQDEEARVARMLESAAGRESRRLDAQSTAMAAVQEQDSRTQQLLQQQREQRAALAKQLHEQEDTQTAHRMELNVGPARSWSLACLGHLRLLLISGPSSAGPVSHLGSPSGGSGRGGPQGSLVRGALGRSAPKPGHDGCFGG